MFGVMRNKGKCLATVTIIIAIGLTNPAFSKATKTTPAPEENGTDDQPVCVNPSQKKVKVKHAECPSRCKLFQLCDGKAPQPIGCVGQPC
ncbi:MAG: hypothetical protein KDJ88_06455 [Bauldia sp.]|nr:hypothetical protein [Bauldia sp.]